MLDGGATDPQPTLRQLIAPFTRAQDSRAWRQVLSTLALFLTGWSVLAWSVVHDWGVLAYLLVALPTAGPVRAALHRAARLRPRLVPRQRARLNDAVGAVMGVITLVPYSYWKKTHCDPPRHLVQPGPPRAWATSTP